MNIHSSTRTRPLLEQPPVSTTSFEEVATDFPLPTFNISPQIADQFVPGCIAIGAIWAVSGLLKQFRLLIEAIDKADR